MNKQKESTANNDMNGDFSAVSMQCKLVLPNSAISIVIGKGGEAVKLLMSNTGAKVVASARQEQLQERIVTITGTFEQAQAAGLDLLTRVQEDTNLGPMIQNGSNRNFAKCPNRSNFLVFFFLKNCKTHKNRINFDHFVNI